MTIWDPAGWASGRRSNGAARAVVAFLARRRFGYPAHEIAADWLTRAIRRTGSDLAVSTALHLTGKIFGEGQCSQLRRRLDLSERSGLASLLLTRGVVLRSHARIDSFRRCLFRAMLKRSRRMPARGNISADCDE